MAVIRFISVDPLGTVFIELIRDDGGTHRVSIEPGANATARAALIPGLSAQDRITIEGVAAGAQTPPVVAAYNAARAAKAFPAHDPDKDPVGKKIAALEARLNKAGIPQ